MDNCDGILDIKAARTRLRRHQRMISYAATVGVGMAVVILVVGAFTLAQLASEIRERSGLGQTVTGGRT